METEAQKVNVDRKTEIEKKMSELATLTKTMDIPDFRRTSIHWLSRNMSIRNSGHKNHERALELVTDLARMGVR